MALLVSWFSYSYIFPVYIWLYTNAPLHVYPADKEPKVYQTRSIEEAVAAKLNISLIMLKLEPRGYFMTMEHWPNVDWQINCSQVSNNFNCTFEAEKLKVIVFKKVDLN